MSVFDARGTGEEASTNFADYGFRIHKVDGNQNLLRLRENDPLFQDARQFKESEGFWAPGPCPNCKPGGARCYYHEKVRSGSIEGTYSYIYFTGDRFVWLDFEAGKPDSGRYRELVRDSGEENEAWSLVVLDAQQPYGDAVEGEEFGCEANS